MRKVIIMFALAMGIITANAQENVTVETTNGSEQPTLTKEVYPQKEADGDLYHGLSRKLTFDRMIPPHGLEVTYDKTVHVIFPAEVRYVDLGSPDLIAGKADGAENIIRVKATVRNFPNETNMSVITEDGSFYTFNVKYAAEPLLLNVEMCDFIHDGSTVNRPNNAQEIYLKELVRKPSEVLSGELKSNPSFFAGAPKRASPTSSEKGFSKKLTLCQVRSLSAGLIQ